MRLLTRFLTTGSLLCGLAGVLTAQTPAPELMVQRADATQCEHVGFSHDGRLLATDNHDELFLWELSTGRLLETVKAYRSPVMKRLRTGATIAGSSRANGTVVFSPDDQAVAVLPIDFGNPVNFGVPQSPPSFWSVDTGLPLTTEQWTFDEGIARASGAPSTPEVETWMISNNRAAVAALLEKGMVLQAISGDGSIGAMRNDEPRNDQHIQVIDLKSGQAMRTIDATFYDVLGMVLSYDGKYLAAHSSNRRFVTIWDTASGADVTEIKQDVQYPSVGYIAFSPDGKWFALKWNADIVLLDTATWKRVGSFNKPMLANTEGQLTFSPDSRMLAIAGASVSLIDVPTGKLVQTVCSSPLRAVTAVRWNDKMFGLASDRFARVWTPMRGKSSLTLSMEEPIRALALSHDGRIALGTRAQQFGNTGNISYVGTTRFWQVDAPGDRTELANINRVSSLSDASSDSVDFAPDGKAASVAMLDLMECTAKHPCDSDNISLVGLLTTWDPATGKLLGKRLQPDSELNVVAYSPDGSQIATGHQERIVKIYETATLNRTLAFKNPENEAQAGNTDDGTVALAFSPDGKSLLAGSRDGLVWLLDALGKNSPRILQKVARFDPTRPNDESSGTVAGVFFSQDGKLAYDVQSSGWVDRWNTSDWTSTGRYYTQAGVASASLSPNGKVIAVAHQDGTVGFYAAASGELKLTLASTAENDSGLVVSPDGRYDFGIAADSWLASYRVGRKTVAVDSLAGNRRVPGILAEFLRENSGGW